MSAPAKAKPQPVPQSTEVATFQAPRLPWHDAIGERFGEIGVTKATWKVLVEAIWPAAKSSNSVVMALSYCQSRRLDPFKKVVHIVPVYDAKTRGYIETVWPSIAEMRTTAFRTGQYAGCDETKFGPDITTKFEGEVKEGDKWVKANTTLTYPEWAQITVYRMVGSQRVPFVGPKVYWTETYARREPSPLPNRMWERRTRGQIEKCAEAGALRKAFPEELGNEYAAEEMEGQRLWHEAKDVTPQKAALAAVAAADIPEDPPAAVITSQPTIDDTLPPEDAGVPDAGPAK